MRKLPSFTIIELVVTMIIASIGIGIMGSAYQIISHQYQVYRETNEGVSRINQLNSLLHKDFDNAMRANWINSTLEIINEEDEKEVVYVFDVNSIVRTQGNVQDVFELKLIDVQGALLGLPTTGFIDVLKFGIENGERIQQFHFSKKYGADVIMSMKEEYGN